MESNMIRKMMTLAAVVAACSVRAQIAKWVIPPAYDAIHMAAGTELIVTDSLGSKVVWSPDGRRLAVTTDVLYPFAGGCSVAVKKGTSDITGFYDVAGRFTKLEGFNATHGHPFFADGYLLVQDGRYFRYATTRGRMSKGLYFKAWPFSNGYASCSAYANIEKQKDPYNMLLTTDLEHIKFNYEDKFFDDDDVDFISSVNDEGLGVVVIKHKAYWFHGNNKTITPLYAKDGETNAKNQGKLDDDIAVSLAEETDTTSALSLKCGKADRVKVRFDALMRPVAVLSPYGDKTFKSRTVEVTPPSTPLRMTAKDGLYGISYGGMEILPPQLEGLLTCFGDKAFVKLGGKYGMLRIMKDEKLRLTINKGNPIDFRHQKYETTIRLDLPRVISAHDTRIEVDPKSGCNVDMTSGEKRDTEFGNYIQYNCTLSIPDSLPDEMVGDESNDIVYPTQVVYDGLRSPMIQLKVKAWHYKYFNVDINDAETTISHGDMAFTFDIKAERNPGEAVYPTSVNIMADTLRWDLEKMSETRYKCRVYGLAEGVNNIVVQILEQGCPPASFPFEVTYTRPVAQKKNKPAVKENVVIRKKTKKAAPPTPAPTPHLDI